MRTAKTISITLPPDLLVKAQELATREHRTMSELFREALRRYMAPDGEWQGFLARARAKGRALGVTSEADVERLSDEHRRRKRGCAALFSIQMSTSLPCYSAASRVLFLTLLFCGRSRSFYPLPYLMNSTKNSRQNLR